MRWVVLAGPVSGYTFELFRHVRNEAGINVGFVHDTSNERSKQKSPSDSHVHDTFVAPDFPSVTWPGASVRALRAFLLHPTPDAVFFYGTLARLPIALSLLELPARVPVLFAADVNIAELTGRPSRTMLRAAAYRLLLRRATGALSLGLTNRLALEVLGARRIFDAPFYAVNYSRFGEPLRSSPPNDRGRLTVLIVARHVREKNLVPFATALAGDKDLATRLRIVFVGEGAERPLLERVVAESPSLCAEVLGPIGPDSLGPLFRSAAALALPSTVEPWGNVVTEALGMGIPVICTPAVGSGVSLAGLTQAVVVAHDSSAGAMCEALGRFVERADELGASARATAPLVRARYEMRAAARGLVQVVDALRRAPTAAERQVDGL